MRTIRYSWILGLIATAGAAQEPRIEMTKRLILPEGVVRSVKEHFAEYRVLTQADYGLMDSSDYDFFFNNLYYGAKVPFACWGDFNADRELDVALLLTTSARTDSQTLAVVFHGRDKADQYDPTVLWVMGHGWLYQTIGLVKKGRILTVKGKGYEGTYPQDFPDFIESAGDCIERGIIGKAASVYYWKDGEYEEILIAD